MFCVRASSRPPRTNPNALAACPKQGRYDCNRFLLRLSSHAIHRGEAQLGVKRSMYPSIQYIH